MIDLRSDTVTKPSPEMRKVMAEAEVGDDVFGEDPTVRLLEETVAEILDKEAALFVPSGTMGNQICIHVHTQPGDEMICDDQCHIFHYEAAAASMFSGVQLKTLTGTDGLLSAEQIEAAINDDDIHHAPTRLIALENTHNRGGGVVYPIETIAAIASVARKFNIAMHLDGARLFNASVYSGVDPRRYAALFDSVMVCLSKGLGAPVGSVIAGSPSFISKARRARKAFGGGMRQAGIIAAGGLYALEHHRHRLIEDHQRAKQLALAIGELKPFTLNLDKVQTNIVIFSITDEKLNAEDVVHTLQANRILSLAFDKKRVRLVTHLDLTDDDIHQTIAVFRKLYS